MSSSERRLLQWLAGFSLCVLGASCAPDPGPELDPRPQALVPAWGMVTESVPVVIEGENFQVLPTQHLGGLEPVTVDARFQAFLGEVALEDVTLEDPRTLRARIPEGLAPGWHTLSLVGPLGRRVELPRAYYASDRVLALLGALATLERDQVSVGERVQLLMTVENTGGTAALAVTPVLRLVGGGQVEILSEPAPADLGPGGSVSFAWELGAAAPGDLRFTLEARGSESTTGVEVRTPGVETGPLLLRERARLTSPLTVSPLVVPGGVDGTDGAAVEAPLADSPTLLVLRPAALRD